MAAAEHTSPIALYIVTHDAFPANMPPCGIPIQAGAVISPKRVCSLCDNTGDNISAKNREYCELTVLYWIWKNDTHPIVGLNHYRRLFKVNADKIPGILTGYDLIVPKAYFFRYSLEKEYSLLHYKKDLDVLLKILHEKHPDWDKTVTSVFCNNQLIPYNMFIARKELINDYCEWLFPILFDLETRLNLSDYSDYQKRVFGFLAERLFTLYVRVLNLKTYSCDVEIPEKSNLLKKAKFYIGQNFNQLYFRLNKKHE